MVELRLERAGERGNDNTLEVCRNGDYVAITSLVLY